MAKKAGSSTTENIQIKKVAPRWIILINAIWMIAWSTIVFVVNGVYPGDYVIWFVIIGICGIVIPWCFVDETEL